MNVFLSRVGGPVLAAVLLHLALMAVYVTKWGGDISALVGSSHEARGQEPLEAVTTSIGPGGYDGMFYYAIARNPFRTQLKSVAMDSPGFRHARVSYSVVCWLVSGGDPQRLLWVMPAVNLAVIGGLAWLGAWFALRRGLSPWWGFVLPLAVNACIPALRNLTDALSTLTVCALLITWLTQPRWWLLLPLALLAVFTREQNVLVVGVLALAAAWRRLPAVSAGLGAALLLWVGWACTLRLMYGTWSFEAGSGLFGTPLGGYCYAWSHVGGLGGRCSTRLAICNVLSLLQFTAVALLAVGIIWRWRQPVVALVLLGGLALAVFATPMIWDDLVAYRRAFVWLPVGVWVAGVHSRSLGALHTLTPAGLFSLAMALHYV